MSEENIYSIIKDSGYVLELGKNPELLRLEKELEDKFGYHSFTFNNGFRNTNIDKCIDSRLMFVCSTCHFKEINMSVMIGFDNKDILKIKSPRDAISAFEWLENAEKILKGAGYDGTFNQQGYNNRRAHSYSYNITTGFNEEFKRALLDFKCAYLGKNNGR